METSRTTTVTELSATAIAALRETLCEHATMFDEPDIYTAGVLDTLDALSGQLPETSA